MLPAGTVRSARLGSWLLALGVVLAFLSKGLVGILIPGAVAGLYLLLRRDWSLLWRARPWWSLLALALLGLPWVLLVSQRNPEFARFFFIHEHFERFLTRVHARYEPDWFFIPVLLVGFMPWTALLPAIAARSWRACRAGEYAAWLLVIWVLFVFVFFSVSQSKLVPYILPMFPALALLAGRSLAELAPRKVAAALWSAAGLWLLLAVAIVGIWQSPAIAARLEIAEGPAAPAIAAGFLLAALLGAGAALLAGQRKLLPAIMLAAFGTLALLGVVLPAADRLPRQRDLVALVAAAAPALGPNTAFYCVDDYEQSIPFYLQRPCTLVGYRGELDFGLLQEPQRWVPDLATFAARWQLQADALAVVRASSYPQLQRMGLPMRVIYTAPSLVVVVRQ
jgi:4-amino-4-deoxy-L-arabinose transferase-like glycosyltransferase